MLNQKYIFALLGLVCLTFAFVCKAQDYDDEGYGNQGGGGGGGGGGQGDNENYQNGGYANDDGYGNAPNYQPNSVDSDSSNNNPSNYSPQSGGDADGDYEGDDGTAAAAAAASSIEPKSIRVKRSVGASETLIAESAKPKLRVKRHGKYYIGPVYTYVKTDKHANFKWGVKHKVGKKHHG